MTCKKNAHTIINDRQTGFFCSVSVMSLFFLEGNFWGEGVLRLDKSVVGYDIKRLTSNEAQRIRKATSPVTTSE